MHGSGLLAGAVNRVLMQPGVSVNSGAIRARADIHPFVPGATLRYRF